VENGVEVTMRDNRDPALYRASLRGHEKVVQLLLNRGSNIDAVNSGGLMLGMSTRSLSELC
jgi:hypothetical protein